MGKGYLIDTNVIIDYTSNLFNEAASAFIENIFNMSFNISVIVKIEALGYNYSPEKMQLLEEFLAIANILPLDDNITQKTIELRRSKKLQLGGAIIAATALIHDLKLISRNTSDFKNIPTLTIINSHSF